MTSTVKTPTRAAHKTKAQAQSASGSAAAQAVLESDREAHLRELDELRSQLLDKPETQIEEADPGVSEQAKNLALVRQLEEHVAEINQALEATKKGTYGLCEQCGEPIDPERLRILPETRLCVRCKRQFEKTAHHHKSRP